VEETGVPWENHRPWQVTDQLYNNVVSSTPRHERDSNSQRLHKTDRHDITEKLLKVALNTINQPIKRGAKLKMTLYC
jgi:hypothetical protein